MLFGETRLHVSMMSGVNEIMPRIAFMHDHQLPSNELLHFRCHGLHSICKDMQKLFYERRMIKADCVQCRLDRGTIM